MSVAVVDDLFFSQKGGGVGNEERDVICQMKGRGNTAVYYYLPLLQRSQDSCDCFVGHIPSDGVFDLELLLLLVESPADDVEIDGFNNEIF